MSGKNHIEKIIISGAGGTVGGHITRQLLEQGKAHVSALTRPSSTSQLPSGLHAVKRVDQNDHDSLVAALKGEDVVIITLSSGLAPDTQKPLIRAAVEAGVKYIMPNEYGSDYSNASLAEDIGVGAKSREIRKYIEEVGKDRTHWIALTSSFWYEFSLAGSEMRYGFDFDQKSLTLFDDGNTKICHTTWAQSARAVANLFALPINPENGYHGPTISQWNNKAVYINSFALSQRDMLASVLRVTGGQEGDWRIKYENSSERYQRGVEKFKGGDMMGLVLMLYTRVFYPNGGGDFTHKLVNTDLALPDEDLDTATAEALRLHNSSFWEDRRAAAAAAGAK